jgi:hypothetical protein
VLHFILDLPRAFFRRRRASGRRSGLSEGRAHSPAPKFAPIARETTNENAKNV